MGDVCLQVEAPVSTSLKKGSCFRCLLWMGLRMVLTSMRLIPVSANQRAKQIHLVRGKSVEEDDVLF